MRFSFWDVQCPEYSGVDSQMCVDFTCLRMMAHQPTVACLWRAKDDCFGVRSLPALWPLSV